MFVVADPTQFRHAHDIKSLVVCVTRCAFVAGGSMPLQGGPRDAPIYRPADALAGVCGRDRSMSLAAGGPKHGIAPALSSHSTERAQDEPEQQPGAFGDVDKQAVAADVRAVHAGDVVKTRFSHDTPHLTK